MKKICKSLFIWALLILSQCGGGQPMHADGGSETVNAEVSDTTLIVTVNARSREFTLYLADTSYLYGKDSGSYLDSAIIVNDQPIRFNLPSSEYNLFIIDNHSERCAAFRNIIVQPGRSESFSDSLSASGSIFGRVIQSNPKANFSVMLKGTPFYDITDTAGSYKLKCIPEGDYTIITAIRIESGNKDLKGNTLSFLVHVNSGSSENKDIYPSK